MKEIYNDACDKNVAVRVVYANSANKIFYDEAFTKEVPAGEALNLFLKGVVAFKNNAYHAAKGCTAAGVIDFGFSA